ncbi:stage II sporulation protein D [Pueribacillus theae]|uniref:Stage II sporulation protein D n=1 Tax=Pueribacillus theae TaxID=2171751 RepID=A0A2U1K376_9BACI|nr:stage II sporulation protein D [Pueribacillus theae]PWA11872.1 stage II sporulation protein D [Pueribacillus theae]
MKRILLYLSLLTTIVILIPTLIVLPFSSSEKQKSDIQTKVAEPEQEEEKIDIPVYRTLKKEVENVPLESYVAGVLSSEMPANFELEALKAQALAARTYIVKQLLHPAEMNLPEGAVVTDTPLHQVYLSHDELKELWGKDFQWKYERIQKAVQETKGKILTYDNQPITASFFSTSNGFTENAEDYWENELPYLKSVASPWDKVSPKFQSSETMPVKAFEEKLGISLSKEKNTGTIMKRTEGKRIAEIKIGDKTFTGREVREKLELNSTDFSIERKGNTVSIYTKGYGHGVGMSQYGANGMAKEGRKAEEIVAHYYKGIEISNIEPFESKLIVKN